MYNFIESRQKHTHTLRKRVEKRHEKMTGTVCKIKVHRFEKCEKAGIIFVD